MAMCPQKQVNVQANSFLFHNSTFPRPALPVVGNANALYTRMPISDSMLQSSAAAMNPNLQQTSEEKMLRHRSSELKQFSILGITDDPIFS